MLTGEGGFASSLDADSEHEEGKFYVWSEAEIDAVLGARCRGFQANSTTSRRKGIGKATPSSTGSIIPTLADAETEALLARCRDKLFAVRAPRVRPGLDDKVLADWNGLMIAALAHAGQVFERPEWIALGERAFAFVRQQMTAPQGRLFHSWRDGKARHPASVDDYANLCRAALALHEATQEKTYLDHARAMDRGARPTLLGFGRRRLFLRRRRHTGADRARQDRNRRRGPGGQRHAGRRADPALDPYRRRLLSPARRGDHSRLRRRGAAKLLPARDPDQQRRAGAKAACRSCWSATRRTQRSRCCAAPSTRSRCPTESC